MVAGFPEGPFILASMIIQVGTGARNHGTCMGVQAIHKAKRGGNCWGWGVRLRTALGGLFPCC